MIRAGLLSAMILLAGAILAATATAETQMLQNVYYIDAQQAHWYIIYVGDKTYRAFYIDNGQTIYITTYRVYENNSFIAFKAPKTTRVYLREESIQLQTLSIRNMFLTILY